MLVTSKLKNAERLKTLQNRNETLEKDLCVADIGAATLKAELESFEWQTHGGSTSMHMQVVLSSTSGAHEPKMSVAVGECTPFLELDTAVQTMEEAADGFRDIVDTAMMQAMQLQQPVEIRADTPTATASEAIQSPAKKVTSQYKQ